MINDVFTLDETARLLRVSRERAEEITAELEVAHPAGDFPPGFTGSSVRAFLLRDLCPPDRPDRRRTGRSLGRTRHATTSRRAA